MKALCILSLSLSIFIAASANEEWDIAVSNENQIEFLTSQGDMIASMRYSHANAFVYDSIHTDLYVSDTSHKNLSIYRTHVSKDGKHGPLQLVLIQSNTDSVCGLAFDPVTSTVFWITGRTIMKAHLNENKTELAVGSVLHKFDDDKLCAIAVDSCKGNIYWTRCKVGNAGIETSDINGGQRTKLVSNGLFKPLAVVISQADRYIYWVDEKTGYEFTIERCALDGTNRQLIVKGSDHQPISIAVTVSRLYWTDATHTSVWSVMLSSPEIPSEKKPMVVKRYVSQALGSVVTAHQDRKLDENSCRNMIDLRTKVSTVVNITSGICLHGSPTQTGSCRCAEGYGGIHCETSLCHNFCLNGGGCSIDHYGAPYCKCPSPFSGARCDTDLCLDKCLNGGYCTLTPSGTSSECHCKSSYTGDRCQLPSNICEHYCSAIATFQQFDRTTATQCGCAIEEINQQRNATMEASIKKSEDKKWLDWSLGASCLVLLSICLILSVIVFKLKGRPRLIRRYHVNPSSVKVSGRNAASDCEIAIENCCNMNICDTPCYEPEFRAPGRNAKSKKEEKRGLLPNIEVQPSDSGNNDLF